MKANRTLLLLCALWLCGVAAAQTTWQTLSSGTTKKLRDVFFTSADTGYVVGEDSILLRTTDRGNTWTILNPVTNLAPGNLNDIWMWGSNGVIAPQYHGGDLKQTTNNGNTWSNQTGPGSLCFPDGVFFVNANEGYLFGTGCFNGAYVSRWNGSAWSNAELLYYGSTAQAGYLGIKGVAYSPASGRYVAVGDSGKIFSSADGFVTFDTVNVFSGENFTAVDYIGNNSFIAVNEGNSFNNVWISTDGGQSFVPDPNFVFTFYYPGFYDFEALPNGFAVAGGYKTTLGGGFLQIRFASTGWGASSYEPVDQEVRGVFVVDSTLAFAVGDSGAIYRYSLPTTVQVQEMETVALDIYPNPVSSLGNIQLNAFRDKAVMIDVFDVTGKQVYGLRDERFTGVISVSAITSSPGIYILRLRDEAGTNAVARIVVSE
jgi:hypothetical protein